MTRNFAYEEWLISVGAIKGDIEKLRAEWKATLAADGAEPEPEPESESWLRNISPALVERAWRPRNPATSHVSRVELLSQSRPHTVDTSGAVDYGTFVEEGFKK
jgi:hypothetical protein